MIEEKASAKVNLCLQILDHTPEGLHLLDSVVVFTEFGDDLLFEKSNKLELSVQGPFSDNIPIDGSNLILKAAMALKQLSQTKTGARITLTKNLPPSAGIGGGSSDAAATIRGLCRLWKTSPPLLDDMLKIGSDLPVCFTQKTQHMQGIGEILSTITNFPSFPILLVNPLKIVSTQKVFQLLKNKQNSPLSKYEKSFYKKKEWMNWLIAQRNDLLEPALKIEPIISEALQLISKQNGVGKVSMSGSGATCFGIFENKSDCDLGLKKIQEQRPDWWSVSTQTKSI